MIFPFMELITWIAGEKANFQIREQEEVAITTNLKEYELRFEEKEIQIKLKREITVVFLNTYIRIKCK